MSFLFVFVLILVVVLVFVLVLALYLVLFPGLAIANRLVSAADMVENMHGRKVLRCLAMFLLSDLILCCPYCPCFFSFLSCLILSLVLPFFFPCHILSWFFLCLVVMSYVVSSRLVLSCLVLSCLCLLLFFSRLVM